MIQLTKGIITLVVLFFSLSPLTAQDNDNLTGALLWKISGKDIKSPSYILGTHHLSNANFVDSISSLSDVIEETQQVAGEVFLEDQMVIQTKMMQAAMMPATASYQNLLSAENYEKLDQNLISLFGVGLSQFGQLKPGMISTLYAITIFQKVYPEFNPQTHEAIDAYIQKVARENGKPILGLETIEDQIYALLDALPLEKQVEDLVCVTGVDVEFAKKQVEALTERYKRGDLSGMYEFSFNNPEDPCPQSPEYKDILLKRRNDKWLSKLPTIMKDKPTLVVVGALHLPGEEGLLYQLQKLGYIVEPVK